MSAALTLTNGAVVVFWLLGMVRRPRTIAAATAWLLATYWVVIDLVSGFLDLPVYQAAAVVVAPLVIESAWDRLREVPS